MKKCILTISIIYTMYFGAIAQGGSDGFFGSWNEGGERSSLSDSPAMPTSPIGSTNNESAPLGSGLLIMTALGAAYGVKKLKVRS